MVMWKKELLIGLAQSLYGIGELTGVNQAIYRQSGW